MPSQAPALPPGTGTAAKQCQQQQRPLPDPPPAMHGSVFITAVGSKGRNIHCSQKAWQKLFHLSAYSPRRPW